MIERSGPNTQTRLLLSRESPTADAIQYLTEWYRVSLDNLQTVGLLDQTGVDELIVMGDVVFTDELVLSFFKKQWLVNNDEDYWKESRIQQDFYALEAIRSALANIGAANYSRKLGIPLRKDIFGDRGADEIDLLFNYGLAVDVLLTKEFIKKDQIYSA